MGRLTGFCSGTRIQLFVRNAVNLHLDFIVTRRLDPLLHKSFSCVYFYIHFIIETIIDVVQDDGDGK